MEDDSVFAGSSLCVVGNVNRDFKTSPIPAGPHLLHDGETPVAAMVETLGGGGANSALAAASLGAQVTFAGKVGVDALGRRLERTLVRQGIGVHLAKDSTHATGTSIALVYDHGHRHFFSCLPASRAMDFPDVNLNALEGKAHLLRADVWFSEPMLFGGNQRLLEHARKKGMAVSLDLNWDPCWGQAEAGKVQARKEAVRAVLPLVHLAHGNVRELMAFTDTSDLKTALQRLAGWGVEAIVAHLGAQGAGYYCQDAWVTEPAAPVRAPIHATGTGDVLSVCMMLLHHRQDLEIGRRLRLANAIVAEFMEGRRAIIPPLDD